MIGDVTALHRIQTAAHRTGRRWHEIGAGTGPVGERSAWRDDGTLRVAR